MARISIPIFFLTALAAGAIGFGASRFADNGAMEKLAVDRDQARDCRHSGSTLPPCPVEYRSTRIVWREKAVATPAPDPRQTERIAALSENLADAQNAIRDLKRRLAAKGAPRPAAYYYQQNGSMSHPYATSDHCPTGMTVMYVVPLSPRSALARRPGDPNVCYVRIARRY